MQIFDFEQRSPEWYAVRLGVPTASEFGSIITAKRGDYAAAADEYINRLLDEVRRPDVDRGFSGTRHMRNGILLEPEGRDLYALETDTNPFPVGFILNDAGTLGCSPDSLVGKPGGLEVKCPDGPTHIRWLRAGGVPDDHKAQVHGSLIITERAWWDFISYCPPYPRLLVRVMPDAYTEKLRGHLDRFLGEYATAREQFNQIMEEAA